LIFDDRANTFCRGLYMLRNYIAQYFKISKSELLDSEFRQILTNALDELKSKRIQRDKNLTYDEAIINNYEESFKTLSSVLHAQGAFDDLLGYELLDIIKHRSRYCAWKLPLTKSSRQ